MPAVGAIRPREADMNRETRLDPVPSGLCFRFFENATPLSFGTLFEQLEDDETFASWYNSQLTQCEFDAFFWEHPPLTRAGLRDDAELVLIESSSLTRLRAEPAPFAAQFERQDGEVIVFPNLGGDALLVVPRPLGPQDVYPHLAAFLRGGLQSQVLCLWQAVAKVVRENVDEQPRWLSTAGLGVSWVHLRLDTTPKYYRHSPYKV